MITQIKRFYSSATLEKYITSTDSTVINYYDTAVDIEIFIQPRRGDETFKNGRADQDVTYAGYCPVSTNADYGDKITQNGKSYKVLYSDQAQGISAVGDHKELILGDF